MAAAVQPTQPLRLPQGPSQISPEQRYWRTFKNPKLIPSARSSPITHISFPSPTAGQSHSAALESFAVTSGNQLQIFSSRGVKQQKKINRFGVDDIAHSGEIRGDGRVVVAGGDSGAVQVFDINSRAILKTWKQHRQPVWTTKWNPSNNTNLMSTSDDKTVKLWDLTENEPVQTLHGHQDYVRVGCYMPGQASNLIASGSYDQTVRLWDTRTSDRAVMLFKHAAAVEGILPMPSGTTLLTSADNIISVLDLVAARPLQLLKSHQKTVTSLCLASEGTRVLSGGLDGHVKIWDTQSWQTVAGYKYASPVLALNVIPLGSKREDKHLAVGLQSGVLSVKTRTTGQQKVLQKAREKEMQALLEGRIEEHDKQVAKRQRTQGTQKRMRGLEYDGASAAQIVVEGNERQKRKKLAPWDVALRKVQYSRALDLVLEPEKPDPVVVLTVLNALRERSALRAALKDRNEMTLLPILKFLARRITDPKYVALTSRVSMLVLELYGMYVGQSAGIDALIEKLHAQVRREVDNSQAAFATQGMLELIVRT